MARVGYARVSTAGQNIEGQIESLLAADCEKVFSDKRSGTTADRPQLIECLNWLREGDTLVVSRLDRLARSSMHLHQIVSDMEQRRVCFICLEQDFDTTSSTGKLVFSVLGAISEFENDLRKERVREGVERAREKGVKFGRKAILSSEKLSEMRAKRSSGVLIKELMIEYGLSKSSVYRLLNQ